MITIPLKNAYILKGLFQSLTDSGTLSCFEGIMGAAYADNELNPKCCGIHLGEYLYIGGSCESKNFLKELFEYSIENNVTIVTLNEDIQELAKNNYGDNCVFTTRFQMNSNINADKNHLLNNIRNLSKEYDLVKIDKNIYNQCLQNNWSEYFCRNFKSYDDFSLNAFGYAILKNGNIVSGTSSYSYYSKGYEIIIATSPDYRRQGLALVSASAFILDCLDKGKIPHWDAANTRSLALSQKLGYTLLREYKGIRIIRRQAAAPELRS